MRNFIFVLFTFLACQAIGQAQNTMCGNGDFESGVIDPAEWSGKYGNFGACPAPEPPINTNSGFSSNLLISANDGNQTVVPAGSDPIIGSALSTVPPFPVSNQFSLRLGNAHVCFGEESMSKTFNVSSSDKFLRFWYAYVGDYSHAQGGANPVTPHFSVSLYDNTQSKDFSNQIDLGNGSNVISATFPDNFVVQFNNQWVYRVWTCVEVPLDSVKNSNVTVTFYNRDCTAGGHAGYTYIDNLCLDCTGSPTGSIDLDEIKSDTCGLPGEICINYTLPNTGNTTGDCQLDLTIYQNGLPVTLFSSPVLTTGSTYCFPLNSGNLAGLNIGLGGFDFSVEGHFSIVDASGNIQLLPDKTLGAAPDGVDTGQNNDYEFICGGANPCDMLMVMPTSIGDDQHCCYAIDLKNNQNTPIAYVEATLLPGDWVFSTGATPGAGFSWFTPAGGPTATSLPISMTQSTGAMGIPQGNFSNALTYCFEPKTANASSPQVVVFTWYTSAGPAGGYRPICQDTIVTQCKPTANDACVSFVGTVTCNPEDPYEYLVNFTVTNNSGFTATHVSLDNLSNPLQFGFSACNASNHLASIAIPLVPPLANTLTSGTLCVKITSLSPILSSTNITLFAGLYNPDECCHRETPVTITLRPCCDPCEDIKVQESPINVPGSEQCCYSLDIINDCAYKFFTKVETEIVTPGIQFGYHAIGGPNATDWNMGASSPTSLLWVLNGANYIPQGTTMDLIQFCIDGIDQASETPQLIAIKWITEDQFGKDSIACTDTLTLNCAPKIDYECLEVTNQKIECSPEDSTYCYTFTVKNTSSIPFGATNLDIFEMSGADIEFTGGGGTFPLPPLNPGNSITLTVCFKPDTFPMNENFLVFRYRLRYLMGDTCCYESTLDTVPVPRCDTFQHDCCYPSRIKLPTGISPNNDGFNDFYVVGGLKYCQKVTLTVYNRWGNVVFKKDNYDNSWDGTNQQGEDLPQGTYFILLTLHDSSSNMSGFVDIRRQ